MSRELGEVFVQREFEVEGRDTAAVLCIGKPAEHPDGDWICRFRITGLGDDQVYEAAGVDSLQALSMALQMVRARLDSRRRTHRITWLGGDDLQI